MDVTVIQLVRGQDAGGSRRLGLTDDQIAGRACLVCGAPDPARQVGWIDGQVPAGVCPPCLVEWQHGTRPARA